MKTQNLFGGLKKILYFCQRNLNQLKIKNMTKLESLHKEILKEKRRIEMLKNTKELDVDFMRSEIKEAQNKIETLQKEYDTEYNFQNEICLDEYLQKYKHLLNQ